MNKQIQLMYFIPYALWIGLFVAFPIFLVFYTSFFDIYGNFSLINYERFFTPVYLTMTFQSFWYALLVTGVSLVIAYPTAYFLTKTKHKNLWLILIILPSLVNLLLKTYSFLGIFGTFGPVNNVLDWIGIGRQQILFTEFSFIFVATYIFIPFMILPIYSSMEKIHPSLLDASSDLGASTWRTFRKVIFPLTLRGVMAGVQTVFIPTLSLFMITRLISGNKVMTLGTAIEQQFLVGRDWGMGSTIAVFLLISMGLLVFLTQGKRWGTE